MQMQRRESTVVKMKGKSETIYELRKEVVNLKVELMEAERHHAADHLAWIVREEELEDEVQGLKTQLAAVMVTASNEWRSHGHRRKHSPLSDDSPDGESDFGTPSTSPIPPRTVPIDSPPDKPVIETSITTNTTETTTASIAEVQNDNSVTADVSQNGSAKICSRASESEPTTSQRICDIGMIKATGTASSGDIMETSLDNGSTWRSRETSRLRPTAIYDSGCLSATEVAVNLSNVSSSRLFQPTKVTSSFSTSQNESRSRETPEPTKTLLSNFLRNELLHNSFPMTTGMTNYLDNTSTLGDNWSTSTAIRAPVLGNCTECHSDSHIIDTHQDNVKYTPRQTPSASGNLNTAIGTVNSYDAMASPANQLVTSKAAANRTTVTFGDRRPRDSADNFYTRAYEEWYARKARIANMKIPRDVQLDGTPKRIAPGTATIIANYDDSSSSGRPVSYITLPNRGDFYKHLNYKY